MLAQPANGIRQALQKDIVFLSRTCTVHNRRF